MVLVKVLYGGEMNVGNDRMSILSGRGSIQENVLGLFQLLLFIDMMTIFVSILLYPGRFPILTYPVSDLGATKAVNGDANTISMLVFIGGMIISAVLMFWAAFKLRKEGLSGSGKVLFLLTIFCGVGYILLTAPDDILDTVHRWGGAFTVGSLWAITILMIDVLRDSMGKNRFVIYHFVLHTTVITYALCFFLDLSVRDIVQKIALLGLGTVWFLTVMRLKRTGSSMENERISGIGEGIERTG